MHEKWGSPQGSLWKRAAELRMNMTKAERILWSCLKLKQLGTKFIPQRPIGPFIVDFCCSECNLIIEVDGDSHGWDGGPEYDEDRSQFLKALGWNVVRYTNYDVLNGLNFVVDDITSHLQ